MHSQELQVLDVSNDEDSVNGWDQELGLLVGTVTDGWLGNVTSESSSDDRVDTLLTSPVLLDPLVTVRVVTLELLGVLLDDLRVW